MFNIKKYIHKNFIETGYTYENIFDVYNIFQNKIKEYTGYPFVVLTDSCTHSIELCLRCNEYNYVEINSKTYLSVIHLVKKLGINYKLYDKEWEGEYHIKGTNIYDSAHMFSKNMYEKNSMKCLSFGNTKPIEIGRGGAILLDNEKSYEWLRRASYDGRDINFKKHWSKDDIIHGYHYNMTIEQAMCGILLIDQYIEPKKFEGSSKYVKLNYDLFN